MLAAVGIGVAISLVLAWLISPVAPAGEVRSVDPSPGRELTGPVILAGLGLAIVLAAAVGLLAWRAARVSVRAETASSRQPGHHRRRLVSRHGCGSRSSPAPRL